ncbi:MAG: hypothetical protein FWG46_03355 [Treponema sp.]|nr:hypothetical protein [Treponema sp.]
MEEIIKHTKFFIVIFIVIVFFLSSCPGTVLHNSDYYKAFFLGEHSIKIEGAVFDDFDFSMPADFSNIFARTDSVDGWEILGIKNGNKFELILNTESNGIILTKETIKNEYPFYGLHESIALIDFLTVFDDPDYTSYPYTINLQSTYREKIYGTYRNWYYYYVYVSEPMDIS